MSTLTQVLGKLSELINLVNATNTNAKKIDELPLQEIIDPASRIHVSIDGVSKRIDISQLIAAVANGNYNQLLNIGEITVVGNVITVPAGAIWVINNVSYVTSSNTVITVTLAATGMNRKDILVGDNSGNIVHEQGNETAGSIIIRPNIPPDTVLVTEFDVSDSTIGDPTPPVVGTQFVEKIEFLDQVISDTGSISIPLDGKSTSFILTGAVASVEGFEMINDFLTSSFYIGKELRIENQTGSAFSFKHNGSTNLPALLPTGADLIVKDKDILVFKPQKYTQLAAKLISVNRTFFEIDAINGLQSELDSLQSNINNKQDTLTDVNVGAFESVVPTVTTIADTDKIPLLVGSLRRMISWAAFKALFKTVGGESLFGSGNIAVTSINTQIFNWFGGTWTTTTLNNYYYISFNGAAVEGLNNTISASMNGRNRGLFKAPFNCKIKRVLFVEQGSGSYTGNFVVASGLPVYGGTWNLGYSNVVTHINSAISSGGYNGNKFEYLVTDNITIPKGYVVSPMLVFSAQAQAGKVGIDISIEIEEVL